MPVTRTRSRATRWKNGLPRCKRPPKSSRCIVSEFGAESRGSGYTSGEHWVRLVLKALEENIVGTGRLGTFIPVPGRAWFPTGTTHPRPALACGSNMRCTARCPNTRPPNLHLPRIRPPGGAVGAVGFSRLFGVIPAVSLAQLAEIQQELKLNDEQKKKVVQLNEQLNDERRQLFQDAAGDFDTDARRHREAECGVRPAIGRCVGRASTRADAVAVRAGQRRRDVE